MCPGQHCVVKYNICIKQERKKYVVGHFDHWDASLFVRMKLSKKIVQVVQQNDFKNNNRKTIFFCLQEYLFVIVLYES